MAMRHHFSSVPPIVSKMSTPWQSNSALVACVFFCLTVLAMSAFFGLMALFELPKGWLTLIISLPVAEMLIQRRKMFGTGIEAALWIGGLFGFIFGLPSEGKPEALLVFAVAAAIAGFRMRNQYFGTLAAVFFVIYPAVKIGGSHAWSGGAAPLAVLLMIVAAAALLRTSRRPSNQALFETLVIVMPLTAYLIAKILESNVHLDPLVAAIFAVLTIALFALGIYSRQHALLIAGCVAIACFGFEVHELFSVSDEVRLIAAGALLVAVGFAISRALRGRTEGIVVAATPKTFFEEAIQVAGSVSIAHPEHVESPPEVQTGGGGFGGGGASGGY